MIKALITNLTTIATSHTLRCDAKQAEDRFRDFDSRLAEIDSFVLGDLLPSQIIKGIQPNYVDAPDEESVPVISTICIQNLRLVDEGCRYVSVEDWEEVPEERRPRKGAILLTVDGGTSIGKPLFFDRSEPFLADSHVVMIQPVGIDPRLLLYLLASPLGQLQFNRAESGASGQTAVTEEDIRRFRFPKSILSKQEELVDAMDAAFLRVDNLRREINEVVEGAWTRFDSLMSD